jgi:hypothetical protein
MNLAWYLQIVDGTTALFSDIGLASLKRKIASHKAGSFLFTAPGGPADAAPLAVEGTICNVLCLNTATGANEQFFSGRIHEIPRKGTGSVERVSYELLDGWHDFEHIVYQQQWTVLSAPDESGTQTPAAEYRSECILGMDINGNALTSGQVIADAVGWAISCGANCQLGAIGVAAPVPLDEVTDIPCSEVIKKMLRWTPDAVTWLDYATTPPTFNVTRRGACAPVNLVFSGVPEEVNIKALPDLVAPCVVIRYIQVTTSNDGPAYVNVIPDIWPPAQPGGAPTTGKEYGAMVMTCRLAEGSATYQKQPLKVQGIPTANSSGDDGGPADDPTIKWWRRKVGWLQKYPAAQLLITNVWGVFNDGEGDDDGTGTVAVIGTEYINELLQGAIVDWMNVDQAKTTWSALVAYQFPSYPPDDSWADEDWAALDTFGPPSGSGVGSDLTSGQVYIAAGATATNGVTQTYTSLSGYTAPESAPEGLAEQLYGAVSVLQYEGSYNFVTQEVGQWSLGMVLNLTGSRAEWTGMNALLQEIEDDLDEGRTTLKFGSVGHLTLQDLVEQLRANRTRTVSSHIKERKTGDAGDVTPVDGATQGASDGGGSPPSNSLYPWIDYIDDLDDGDGHGLTWDALLGFGQSSFAGSDGIDHAGALEKLEISVGNDEADWPDNIDSEMSSLDRVLSIVSGDDNDDSDWMWIGRIDDSGNGGSIRLLPHGPEIYLSENLNPDDDGDGDPFIHIDLGNMIIQMQDEDGSYLQWDLSDDPTFTVYEDGSSTTIDDNSATFVDSGGNSITIDAGSSDLNMSDSSGNYIDLNANGGSMEVYGNSCTISIDTADADSHDMSIQEISICVDGSAKNIRILASAPY